MKLQLAKRYLKTQSIKKKKVNKVKVNIRQVASISHSYLQRTVRVATFAYNCHKSHKVMFEVRTMCRTCPTTQKENHHFLCQLLILYIIKSLAGQLNLTPGPYQFIKPQQLI